MSREAVLPEAERESAEEALRRTEQQYRSVVDNIKQVIFQTDARGVWKFLNAAWTEITGFGIDETLGKSFLSFVHPEDRMRHAEMFQPLIENRGDHAAGAAPGRPEVDDGQAFRLLDLVLEVGVCDGRDV